MGDGHFHSRERTVSTGVGNVGDLGCGADGQTLAHEVHRVGVCARGVAFLGVLGI